MKGVVLKPGNQLALEEVPEPQLESPTDLIVKVTTASICGSDIHIKHGDIPIPPETIIGHEFVGLVEEVGSGVVQFRPGDRISVPAGIWCGLCPACRRGEETESPQRGGLGRGLLFRTAFGRAPRPNLSGCPMPISAPCPSPIRCRMNRRSLWATSS